MELQCRHSYSSRPFLCALVSCDQRSYLSVSSSNVSPFPLPHTVQFHIGHLFHLGGQFLAARKTFEEILMAKSVPSDIKAMALRQLGEWCVDVCVCVCGYVRVCVCVCGYGWVSSPSPLSLTPLPPFPLSLLPSPLSILLISSPSLPSLPSLPPSSLSLHLLSLPSSSYRLALPYQPRSCTSNRKPSKQSNRAAQTSSRGRSDQRTDVVLSWAMSRSTGEGTRGIHGVPASREQVV